MSNGLSAAQTSNLHTLPLDTVWAWLVTRETLVADDAVADVEFFEVGNARDVGCVRQVEAMPGVDPQSQRLCLGCGAAQACQLDSLRGATGTRIASRMQFDERRAGFGGDLCATGCRFWRRAHGGIGRYAATIRAPETRDDGWN